MALKGEQSATLDEIILQGELDEEQARNLLREHKSNVATLEKLMDEEVSRQRMLLEEKLSTRKAMAHASVSYRSSLWLTFVLSFLACLCLSL